MALFEDRGRNESPEIFERENYGCYIVHLANDRYEVWKKLYRADDVKKCASRNRLGVPWHAWVYKSTAHNAKLMKEAGDESPGLSIGYCFAWLG